MTGPAVAAVSACPELTVGKNLEAARRLRGLPARRRPAAAASSTAADLLVVLTARTAAWWALADRPADRPKGFLSIG